MDKFYKYDYDDTTRGVAAAADPSEIQEGGEVHSRLLVGGGKGRGRR
jgi:hypothetical protein